MTVLRVFPRRNKATPDDEYTTTEYPGLFMPENVDAVHVSCAFTYDLDRAYDLAEAWRVNRDWSTIQRSWVAPQIIYTRVKKAGIV